MEYLQYFTRTYDEFFEECSFKPYYKWNTFNTPGSRLKNINSFMF